METEESTTMRTGQDSRDVPMTGSPAPAVSADRAPQHARHRRREILVQLVTITAGVLIALFFDGLVAWNQDRQLVNEARRTIRREKIFMVHWRNTDIRRLPA